jgi:hypothetical protein
MVVPDDWAVVTEQLSDGLNVIGDHFEFAFAFLQIVGFEPSAGEFIEGCGEAVLDPAEPGQDLLAAGHPFAHFWFMPLHVAQSH